MSERGRVGGGILVLHSEKMGRQNKAVLQVGCYGSRGVILLCPAPKRGQTGLVYENGMLTKQQFIKVLYRCSNRKSQDTEDLECACQLRAFRERSGVEIQRDGKMTLRKL